MNLFRPSKFTFYILSNELHPDEILTITNTEDECKEFYHKYLYIKHLDMFKPWCERNGLDPSDIFNWDEYYRTRISSAETGTYKFSKMKFTRKELAALLRALSATPLIGCNYESDFDKNIRTPK